MTDERLGDDLWPALAALPKGKAGIIFRHYATPDPQRRALFEAVRRIARARRLMLVLADTPQRARGWRAEGSHGRHVGALTAPAHNVPEVRAAERAGAELVLLSPLFATRSHAGARPLGRVRFGLIAEQSRRPIIALGGMTAARYAALKSSNLYGWAAIDGLARPPRQKRKAVPR
jgi:thiamine-phosphate pyrophosphorylase